MHLCSLYGDFFCVADIPRVCLASSGKLWALRKELRKGCSRQGYDKGSQMGVTETAEREQGDTACLTFCVPKGRGAQRVDRVKPIFETKAWTDRSALLGIWALAVHEMGSHLWMRRRTVVGSDLYMDCFSLPSSLYLEPSMCPAAC